MSTCVTISPIDVCLFRGNRLFGATSEHNETAMPPWPSVFSGAIRSRILADRGIDWTQFLKGTLKDAKVLKTVGTADAPGPLRLTWLALFSGGQAWFPLPADLTVFSDQDEGVIALEPLPRTAIAHFEAAFPLASIPVLRRQATSKPLFRWVNGAGLASHLKGQPVKAKHLIVPSKLWDTVDMLGIALAGDSRTADEGRIYTSEAVALLPGVSFIAGFDGHGDLLPVDGLVRLGGDGKSASIHPVTNEFDFSTLSVPITSEKFRVILSTPGVFPDGWMPPCVEIEQGDFLLRAKDFTARLVSAAVPSYQTISGWDVARQEPKSSMRMAPIGSVYWFETISGDTKKFVDMLRREGWWPLIANRLGGELTAAYAARRAEGFSNVWVGNWK